MNLKNTGGSKLRTGLAALLFCCAPAANVFAVSASTEAIRTNIDALDFLSQQTGQGANKFAQDYIYTGNDRVSGLRARFAAPAVRGDPAAAQVPVARYTAPAGAIKLTIKGTVPPLPASGPAVALTVKGLITKAAGNVTMDKSAAPEKTSVFQKVGKWFSDAYSAVKSWISNAATWVHDKIMGKGRPLTAEEIEGMKPVFGDSVDYSKVRIVTGDNMGLWGKILTSGNAAVTWGKTIYFPNGAGGKSQYSLDTKAYWLAHEMTHEYQYQKYGWGYVPSSVWGQLTKGQAFYEYQLEGGKGFRKYNVEQQADLVAHYYQILDGTRSATPAELAIYRQIMKDQGLFKGTGSN